MQHEGAVHHGGNLVGHRDVVTGMAEPFSGVRQIQRADEVLVVNYQIQFVAGISVQRKVRTQHYHAREVLFTDVGFPDLIHAAVAIGVHLAVKPEVDVAVGPVPVVVLVGLLGQRMGGRDLGGVHPVVQADDTDAEG